MKKVLIVDDQYTNIILLRECLNAESIECEYVNKGLDAINILKIKTFDLILLDVMMPDMNGFETCKIIKQIPEANQIPIIFITARVDRTSIVTALESGGVDYIQKPFVFKELIARVNIHLELSESKKKLMQELKEKEAIEKKLRYSESIFKTIFSTTSDMIILTDIKGRIIDANESAVSMLGYTYNQLIGMDSSKIINHNKEDESFHIKNINQRDKIFEIVTCFNKYIKAKIFYHKIFINNEEMIFIVFHDMTQQIEIQQKIFSAILETENKERKTMADLLHDEVGLLLSSLKIFLSLLEKTPKKSKELTTNCLEIIDSTISTVKNISNDLNPHILDRFGLQKAIERYIRNIVDGGLIEIIFVSEDYDAIINKNMETILYRCTKEMINNTLKHAKANQIKIHLSNDNNNVFLNFEDNGVGYNIYVDSNNLEGRGIANIENNISSIGGSVVFNPNQETGFGVTLKLKIQ